MKRSVARSLEVRFLCVAAVLVVVVAMAVGWTLAGSRRQVGRAAEQAANNVALTVERDIERSIGSLDMSLRAAVRGMAMPGLAAMPPAIRQAILFDGAIAAMGVDGVLITDDQGHALYSNRTLALPRTDVSARRYFQLHRDHPDLGLLISGPTPSRFDGLPVLVVSRRISATDGAFAGVALATLKAATINALFESIELGRHGLISLATLDRGILVRHPGAERDPGQDQREDSMFRDLAGHSAGSFWAGGTGGNRLYSFRRVADLSLVLWVVVSSQEIYADWTIKALLASGALVLLSCATAALAWALAAVSRRRGAAERSARALALSNERLAQDGARALAPLEALFRNSADMMLTVKVGASDVFVYESVNPVWEKLTGVAAATAIGRTQHACLPGPIADMLTRRLAECVQQRRALRFPFRTPAAPAPREWEAMAVPIPATDGGEIRRLIVVGHETTEHNRLEVRVRHTQKMEAIGRVAAGVSHDFNNILQVITGGVDVVRDDPALSPQGTRFLDIVDKAAMHGANLTNHLLSYSRKQMLQPRLLDLSVVAGDLCMLLSRTLGTNVTVTTAIAPALGQVRADRSMLETALMNIAINSAQAMPDGGTISLTIRRADAAPETELDRRSYIVIAIADTGCGMTPEVMACVFDPFFTTRGLEAPGLGLAMAYGFARQSGGDVRVASQPGQGTCVEIWLPEVPADVPPPVAAPVAAAATSGDILLVDDAEDILTMMEMVFGRAGFAVHAARSGPAALAAVADGRRFDIMITDYMMPGMNGPEVIEKVRATQPDLPVIVLSGFGDAADSVGDLPATVVLHKPIKRDQLLAEVRALLVQAGELAVPGLRAARGPS